MTLGNAQGRAVRKPRAAQQGRSDRSANLPPRQGSRRGEGLGPPAVCNATRPVLLSPSNLGILLESTCTDRTQERQATGSFHTKSQSELVHFRSAVASAGKSFPNYETLVTCLSLFFNGYFLFLLLTGILPWAGHGSETAEIPVSRAGWLVFLAPAGSTRHGNRQQLLVILQPVSPIHKGLAKLDKFLKIFAPWWFIQTERASPRMHSSKAAGTGPHSCPTPLPGLWKRGSLAAGDASLWHGC